MKKSYSIFLSILFCFLFCSLSAQDAQLNAASRKVIIRGSGRARYSFGGGL